jgi:hypothetical protein
MRQLMDKQELIEYTNGKLRPDTLGRLTREGKIPVVKFPGIRRFFYDQEAIDLWLNNLQAESNTKKIQQEPENLIGYGKLRKIQG